jgi:TrwC relaxase
MDGCALCIRDQDDLAEGVTITPIYHISTYESLADRELARKLLIASMPIYEARQRMAEGERDMLPEDREAARFKRSEPPFLDITVWPQLSVALLWAGLLSAAEKSRRDGDPADAREHERNAEKVDAAVMASNTAAMDFLQDEAGHARIDPPDMDSRYAARWGASRWLDAHDWVTGAFPQFVGFSGGPRLHVHNLIVNRVQAEQTGEWGYSIPRPWPTPGLPLALSGDG